MTPRVLDSAGKGSFSGVHNRRTNLTSRHVTTAPNMSASNAMGPKELEDRLAAAEALSSLGSIASVASAFQDSALLAELSPALDMAPDISESSKGEAKGRGRRGKNGETGAGRETKSRSSRGRGRPKVVAADRATGAATPPLPVHVDSSPGDVPPPDTTPAAPKPTSSRGRGRPRGRGGGGGGRRGNKTSSGQDSVTGAASVVCEGGGQVEPGSPHPSVSAAGTWALGAGGRPSVHGHGAAATPAAVRNATHQAVLLPSLPRCVGNHNNTVSAPSVCSSPVASNSTMSVSAASCSSLSLLIGKVSSPLTLPPTPTPTSTYTPTSTPTSTAPTCTAPTSAAPTLVYVGLPSQSTLSSLRLDSLSGFSLGSSVLPNLPSIPNLPSLPSAIPSLQLSASSMQLPVVRPAEQQEDCAASQLSPQSRDSGEKSLPLKKRKVIDSSSSSSSLLSSSVSSLSVPKVSSGNLASSSTSVPDDWKISTVTASLTGARSPEKSSDEVLSPAPVLPMNLLPQVLPPAMCRQLMAEIETAITPDEDGDVPLHIAVVHENEAMVKKLIQLMALAGQRVDRYNKQHQTPLHLAVKLTSLSAIQMLLEAGSDPNLVDSGGLTSTHMAVQVGDIDGLEALLQWSKYPCDLNYRNFEGLAPLHTAVLNNDLEIVMRLLEQGADINIMDGKSGRTVLFHAAESNQRAAVEVLLSRGADPEIANYAGVVPALAAQGRSHTTVARLLARALEEGGGGEGLEKGGGGEEEGGGGVRERKEGGGKVMVVVDSRRSPLEAVVSEEFRRGSPRLSIQESGRRSSTSSSATRQAVKTDGQGLTFTTAPSILQSSTVPGSTAAPLQPSKNVGWTSVVECSRKAADVVQEVRRLGPGSVIRATHPMPGVVTKAMKVSPSGGGPPPQSTIVVRRNSVPIKTDPEVTSLRVSKSSTPPVPGGATASLPLGLLRSPAQGDYSPALLSVRGGQRVVGVMKSESEADRSLRGMSIAPSTSVTEDELRRLQGLPMSAAPSVAVTEEDRQRLLMQNLLKMVVEQQNGGQARLVNWPQAVPGIMPLPVTTTTPCTPAEGRHRNSPAPCGPTASPPAALRGANRVIPLPVPTSSMVTSPAVSEVGGLLSSLPLTTTTKPLAAHSQPTHPLLVFRSSSSVDPGSGGGQVGSVELRHVTTDALLALQHSATNSVNPANQNRGSAPLHFQPHVSATAARPATFTLPMKAEMVAPPVSNHVARDGVTTQTATYASDGDPDEPTDLSLKPKKRADGERASAETDQQLAKKSGPQGLSLVKKPETSVGAKGSGGKKRKSEAASFQDQSTPTPRKVHKTESAEATLKAEEETSVEAETRAAARSVPPGSPSTGRGAADGSSAHAEGAVISISESGVITSRSTLEATAPALVVEVSSSAKSDASPLLMSALQRTVIRDGTDAERVLGKPPAALLVPDPRKTTLKEHVSVPPSQAPSALSAKAQVRVERSVSSSQDFSTPPAIKPLVTRKHQETKAASSQGTSRSRSPLDSVRSREGGDETDGNGGSRRQRSSTRGEPASSRLSRSACQGSSPREVDGKDQSLATG